MGKGIPTLTTANNDDLLWKQLKTVPAFRALLRAVEARFYQNIELPQPILDIGCGDGHFAQMTFNHPIQVGIDPWWNPLIKAEKSGMYDIPLQALGDMLPFADHTFASAFSNSVLEHIPDIQPVLDEIGRILMPGAPFVITVPSHYFTEYLGGAEFFDRLGLDSFAGGYQRFFNRISRHAHTDAPEAWAARLANAGFSIDRWQYYFSRKALHALEIGHAQGIPSAVLHALTGHWILGPWESNLQWTERWVRPFYEEPFPEEGAYIFILARKSSDEPITPSLPASRPFTLQELMPVTESGVDSPVVEGAFAQETTQIPAEQPVKPASERESAPDESKGELRPLVTGIIAVITLLLAFLGQSTLRNNPYEPGSGLRWIGISLLSLLVLLWYVSPSRKISLPRVQRPTLAAVSKRRWFYLPALLLVFIASRLGAANGTLSPFWAVLIWVLAIILAVYALIDSSSSQLRRNSNQKSHVSQFTLVSSVLLFFAALAVRLYNLGQHPFILNGTEASLGLEALNILNGNSVNPFGTGFLTNPNLPSYFLSLPIKILGPSTFAIRILSPFIGAITVVATFLIGKRLYGRTIGLAAAVLLLGSHFHLHFSRLGMTNAWDALLVLLSLGLIGIAWQQPAEEKRHTWLWAGLAVGFSAYLYTSSHLLPLMLLLLFLVILFTDRTTLQKQWSNIFAMAALALIVALPQLLYYQANSGIFMERANALGILDMFSGWLNQESARTGISQIELFGQQLERATLAFNAVADSGSYYGPFVPLLNFLSGILFLFGLFLSLIRLRQIRFSMLLVWVIVTVLFAGALLINPPNSHRYIIVAPALSFLAAIALEFFVSLFHTPDETNAPETADRAQALPTKQQYLFLAIPIIIALLIATYDISFYFGPYRARHQFADRNTEIADSMAKYLSSLDGDWSAYFYGPPSMYVGFPTIPFLAQNFAQGSNLFDVQESGIDFPLANSDNITFLFLPERVDELPIVKIDYPGGEEKSFNGYYASPLFYAYEIGKEGP